MTIKTRTLIRTLALTLMIGVFIGFIGLIAFGSPPSLLAQTDTAAPTISSVTITSDTGDDDVELDDDGVYGIGDTIEATVNFNEDVMVTGSPQLELTIGNAVRKAEYKSTAGGKLMFIYSVVEGDSDTDGVAIGANKVSLNGGSIKDDADNDAILTHTALSAQSGHKVDGIRPTVTAVSISSPGVAVIGDPIFAYVDFSEYVFVGTRGFPEMSLNLEGTTKTVRYWGAQS